MFLDLSRLEDGRFSARFEIDRESPVLAGFEGDLREPLIFDVEVRNPSGSTFVVNGRLAGTVVARCRRCLEPTVTAIDVPFRVIYQEAGRDAERSEEPGDDDIVWLERGAKGIELDDQVRDRLFLEAERFPLCRPDCRGICPNCGQILNEGSCDCRVEAADSRWKALGSLQLGEKRD
ncbi:hypothetical protein BH20GEM1_BH20GEM1_07700 [soil metagenome]